MAVEHRNPLPEGRYWVMLIGKLQIEKFDEWLKRTREFTDVISSELDPGGINPFFPTGRSPFEPEPPSQFVVFDVLFSDLVKWEGPGLPNIVRANEDVTSRQDVEQSPIVDEPSVTLGKFFTGFGDATTVVLVLGALYLLSKDR
jgi:hypothetical protein